MRHIYFSVKDLQKCAVGVLSPKIVKKEKTTEIVKQYKEKQPVNDFVWLAVKQLLW